MVSAVQPQLIQAYSPSRRTRRHSPSATVSDQSTSTLTIYRLSYFHVMMRMAVSRRQRILRELASVLPYRPAVRLLTDSICYR